MALAAWAWVSQTVAVNQPATAVPAGTMALPEEATPEPAATTTGLVGLATPWAVAGMEPSATPEASVAGVPAPIALFGPPPGIQFGREDTVSFYWSWPDEVTEGQRFVVYLAGDSGRVAVGRVEEQNLGRIYHLAVPLSEAVQESGAYRWQVVLEGDAAGDIIGESELRLIGVLGG